MAGAWEVLEERPVGEWDVVATEPVQRGPRAGAGAPAGRAGQIPGVDPEWAAGQSKEQLEEQRRQQARRDSPIAERIAGAIEGALDIVAKIGGGTVGGLLGLAGTPFSESRDPEANMVAGAQRGVEAVRSGYGAVGLPAAQGPTTATGADISEGFDLVTSALPPVGGVYGTLAAPAANAPRGLAPRQLAQALPSAVAQTGVDALPPMVADGARRTVDAARTTAQQSLERGVAALPERMRPAGRRGPTPGTQGSVGAAGTDVATQRRVRASSLPVPIELTAGQASRDFDQLRFENETAKASSVGAPLREHHAEQNQRLLQNLDALEELTGAQSASSYDAGSKVVQSLAEKAAKAKKRIDDAYTAAREAGESADPVSYRDVMAYAEEQTPTVREKLAPIVRMVEEQLQKNDPDGTGTVSIDALERIRQAVRANSEPGTPNGFHAGELIRRIDAATEGAGGDLYKAARKLRFDYAREFEARAVVADLLGTKKGSDDRTVKLERVVDRVVRASGVDDLAYIKRVLLSEGDAGRQSWKEMQGRVIADLRDPTLGVGGGDIRGNPIVSPAKLAKRVTALDADGKLEVLFGKKGAETLRDLVDATRDIKTAPPGAVNTSHTTSALRDLWDQVVTFGLSGVPARGVAVLQAVRKDLADRKVRKQVREALPAKSDAGPRSDLSGLFEPTAGPTPAAPDLPARPAQREASPNADPRLQEIERVKAASGDSPETLRVLDAQTRRIKREIQAGRAAQSRETEADALERAANSTFEPPVRQALLARANELRANRLPTGEARELREVPVARAERATAAKPVPTGEARELSVDQARTLVPTRRERDLLRLRDEASDPVVLKELDKAISVERTKATERARGKEYLRLADEAEDPELRELMEGKAAELGVKRRPLPVGEATEIPVTPGTTRAVQAIKLNTQDQAAWNLLHRMGGLDAGGASLMTEAARYDAEALDKALAQFASSPAQFERELHRIVKEGKRREK